MDPPDAARVVIAQRKATSAWFALPLLPLLIAQGLRVRRITPRLPEPDGERDGVFGAGPDLGLLILGDSAAAGVGAMHQQDALAGQLVRQLAPHFRVRWHLRARTGDDSAHALARLRAEPELRCDVAITSLGVNDITGGMRCARFLALQMQILDHLQQHCGARQVLVSGLPPVHAFPALPQPLRWAMGQRARRFDAALAQQLALRSGVEHLTLGELPDVAMLASDGFHPGPPVYAVWAEHAASRIRAAAHL